VDSEARTRISDLEAKNWQENRKLCSPQKEVLDLHEANKGQMQDIAEIREGRSREAAELLRLAGENATFPQASRVQKQEIDALRCAQAKFNKEMGELRPQLVQALTNHAKEWEALKQEMAELREAQKREIAALCGEFTERDSSMHKELVIVKEAQQSLRQQLVDSNGAQERENAAQIEEIAGLQRQQETFA
jgi:hypothetical protein